MLARFSAVSLVAILLLMPFVLPKEARAEVPNVGGTGAISTQCPSLTRTLSFGSRGADVTQLQNFLIARGHLAAGNNTGYFGSLTQAAVQAFQKANAVVSSGTPATTGYGAVGPRTRTAIALICGGGNISQSSGISMSASPINGQAPLTVAFVVIASAAYCSSYSLDFGDGSVEDLKNFCGTRTIPHVYSGQGTHNARLETVTGSQRKTVAEVSVTTGAAPVSTPSCTMSLSKNTIQKGQSTTLTWSSTGATTAKWADGAETGTSGSTDFTNLAANTTKTIEFKGEGGTKTCSVTVTVTAPPSGTIVASGNATANGSVAELPAGGQSAFKLAEFTLKAGAQEAVVMKKLNFTLRNQTSDRAPGAATVSNYRVTVGTASYSVSVSKSGIYETGSVPVGALTIAANQSLGVAIFADIVPNSGGHLDLWVYPADTEFTGVTTGVAIVPISQVTNRVDSALLYWSGWISVIRPKATESETVSGDCILNGVGQSAVDVDMCAAANGGPGGGGAGVMNGSTGGDAPDQCKKLEQGQMICTTKYGWTGGLWGGGYINPQGSTVACTSSNTMASPYGASGPIWVPGGMKVLGLTCTESDTTSELCSGYYICKKDGWWKLSSTGYETKKIDSLNVLPESFY